MRSVALMLVGCLGVGCDDGAGPAEPDSPDASRANELTPTQTLPLPNALTQASGLAWLDGALYAVGDQKSRVYRLTLFAVEVDRVDLDDAECDGGAGFEAVAHDGTSLFLACEPSGEILRVDPATGLVHDRIPVTGAVDGNGGLEGLSFLPHGDLMALKEKGPTVLVHLTAEGDEVARATLDFAPDMSGLAELSLSDCPDQLLAVSQEARRVFQLDSGGRLLASWPIAADRPEGVAYADGHLYIVDEDVAKLLVFDFTAECR